MKVIGIIGSRMVMIMLVIMCPWHENDSELVAGLKMTKQILVHREFFFKYVCIILCMPMMFYILYSAVILTDFLIYKAMTKIKTR